MPRMTMRRYGVSASVPVGKVDDMERKQPKRTKNRGWTLGVSRRNAQFLQSVDFENVPGRPYAITLTLPVREMERVTPESLHRYIDRWLKFMRARGLMDFHWVIEFTAAHMPHVHVTAWLADTYTVWSAKERRYSVVRNDDAIVTANAITKWLDIVKHDGIHASSRSQDIKPIEIDDGPAGWLAYVAKHTQRGVKHYQRALDSMPDGWRQEPGRMWGHSRTMPVVEPVRIPMSNRAFHQFRREVKKWCVAQARKINDSGRRCRALSQARGMNACSDPRLSPVRPISVWIPEDVQKQICRGMRKRGYLIGNDAYEWGLTKIEELRVLAGERHVSQETVLSFEREVFSMLRA